jgi:hypothetical protein
VAVRIRDDALIAEAQRFFVCPEGREWREGYSCFAGAALAANDATDLIDASGIVLSQSREIPACAGMTATNINSERNVIPAQAGILYQPAQRLLLDTCQALTNDSRHRAGNSRLKPRLQKYQRMG